MRNREIPLTDDQSFYVPLMVFQKFQWEVMILANSFELVLTHLLKARNVKFRPNASLGEKLHSLQRNVGALGASQPEAKKTIAAFFADVNEPFIHVKHSQPILGNIGALAEPDEVELVLRLQNGTLVRYTSAKRKATIAAIQKNIFLISGLQATARKAKQ